MRAPPYYKPRVTKLSQGDKSYLCVNDRLLSSLLVLVEKIRFQNFHEETSNEDAELASLGVANFLVRTLLKCFLKTLRNITDLYYSKYTSPIIASLEAKKINESVFLYIFK